MAREATVADGPAETSVKLGECRSPGDRHGQLAAYAIERRAELHSNDTDFARFGELKWVNPLQ